MKSFFLNQWNNLHPTYLLTHRVAVFTDGNLIIMKLSSISKPVLLVKYIYNPSLAEITAITKVMKYVLPNMAPTIVREQLDVLRVYFFSQVCTRTLQIDLVSFHDNTNTACLHVLMMGQLITRKEWWKSFGVEKEI